MNDVAITLPVTFSVVPSNVKFPSALAAFDVPSDVNTLLSEAFDTVENPVPLVPDEPDAPLVPDVQMNQMIH